MSRPDACPRCGRSCTAHTGSYCHECGEPLFDQDPTASAEDVVVYIVKDDGSLMSYGRGTQLEAEQFVRQPKYPAHDDDMFVAINDWGHGTIVAATDKTLVGKSKREVTP